MRDIPLDNLSYSLLLELDSGISGSGFLVNSKGKIFLVTAKHVIIDLASDKLLGKKLKVTGYTNNLEDGDTVEYSIDLNAMSENKAVAWSSNEDVAVIKLGTRGADGSVTLENDVKFLRIPSGRTVSVAIENVKKISDVLIANTVFIQGYPSSIGLQNIPQINYRKPLVRRGVVAGKNETLNTIVLDCEVHPGNSGGPVVEVEQLTNGTNYKLIGIVSQRIPFLAEVGVGGVKGQSINNSGYSVIVPCDPMIDLINSLSS